MCNKQLVFKRIKFMHHLVITYRYKDDDLLTQSVKYMQIYRGGEFELKISRCKMEDKGEYKVRAENSFGRREEVALLKVEGRLVSEISHSFKLIMPFEAHFEQGKKLWNCTP